MRQGRRHDARPRYLTDDELRALLRAARERRHYNAERDRLLFTVLANCGVRPGEALRLRLPDLELGRTPYLRIRRLKKRRDGYLDDVPLTESLARQLRGYVRELVRLGSPADGPLFPAMRAEPRALTVRSAERAFERYAVAAGIPGPPSLYSLRHTYGRRIYAASRDLRLVQRALGHEHQRTSEIYAHLDPAELTAALEKMGTIL